MKLGIKVGPNPSSFHDLDTTNPDMCEVWFDVSRENEYTPLFSKLTSMDIDVGLHFWGVLPDKTWANIAYPDKTLNEASSVLIERTIDIAASHGFKYVNIHPGARARIMLDFSTYTFTVMTKPADERIATENFLMHATRLSEHAKHYGVTLTVETVPVRVINDYAAHPENRTNAINVYELGLDAIRQTAHAGIAIANDFCHTAASYVDTDRTRIWKNLLQTTTDLASQTRLLHLGFVIPPYNGTDFHGDLDHPAFATSEAIPNTSEFVTLLKIFTDRPDVWALVEPPKDHVKNYLLAKNYIETAKNTP